MDIKTGRTLHPRTWEMLSEALTIIGNIAYYRKCYKGIPGLSRMIFWTATGILTVGG